jgi:hypothetical protein
MAKFEQQEATGSHIMTLPNSISTSEPGRSGIDAAGVSVTENRDCSGPRAGFDLGDEDEEPGLFFKGFLIALPISLFLWAIIIWAIIALISYWTR